MKILFNLKFIQKMIVQKEIHKVIMTDLIKLIYNIKLLRRTCPSL